MKKKWLIVIAIVIVLAVVLTIVFINLFTPKHTTELANSINSVTQVTGYLNAENESNKSIKKFLTDQKDNVDSQLEQRDKVQIDNYLDSLNAFEIMAQFYNRNMLFASHTSVYANNKDAIINSFKDANKLSGELAKYFDAQAELSDQYKAQAWKTKAGQMKSLFDKSYTAFTKLSAIYTSCITSKMMNNEMSKAVLKVTNYFLSLLKTDLHSEELPSFKRGTDLLNFVKVYYPKEKTYLIYNAEYDESALALAKKINEAEDLSTYSTSFAGEWEKFINGTGYSTIANVVTSLNYAFEEAV